MTAKERVTAALGYKELDEKYPSIRMAASHDLATLAIYAHTPATCTSRCPLTATTSGCTIFPACTG